MAGPVDAAAEIVLLYWVRPVAGRRSNTRRRLTREVVSHRTNCTVLPGTEAEIYFLSCAILAAQAIALNMEAAGNSISKGAPELPDAP